MARLFDDAAGDHLENTSGSPVTGQPVTMACWALTDDLALPEGKGFTFELSDSAEDNRFALQQDDSDVVGFSVKAGGTGTTVLGATLTQNQWHHFCGISASSTDHRVFLDGANKATDATSLSTSGLDRVHVGIRPNGNKPWSGKICECAAWDVALSDAEVAVLALGVKATFIRPESLVFYAPIWGRASPEPEFVGGLDLTLTGTAYADPPRLIYTAPQAVVVPAAAGGGPSSKNYQSFGFANGPQRLRRGLAC